MGNRSRALTVSGDAVRLKGVSLRGASGEPVLERIDWNLPTGEVAVVIGPSGSGKTRMLRLLDRLDEPSEGALELLGRSLYEWDVQELRRNVLLVPQRPALSAPTGRDNLELLVTLGLISRATLSERLAKALDVTGTSRAMLDQKASLLSGGERQRVALARALLLQPRLLLLDEPTSALDTPSAMSLCAGLLDWKIALAASLIVVTHRLAEARMLGGHAVVLMHGRVEETGPTEQILSHALSARVREFVAEVETGASR